MSIGFVVFELYMFEKLKRILVNLKFHFLFLTLPEF